jgi:hypothetical protein
VIVGCGYEGGAEVFVPDNVVIHVGDVSVSVGVPRRRSIRYNCVGLYDS